MYKGGFFMSLKKQLKTIVKKGKSKCKERERQEELKLVRSCEDWKIVESYLEKKIKEMAADPYSLNKLGLRLGNYIRIDKYHVFGTYFAMDDNGNFITLSDGSNFKINYKDIQQFCKQHKLKLLYESKVYGEVVISKNYYGILTEKYLIKV